LKKYCVSGYRDKEYFKLGIGEVEFVYPARKGYNNKRENWGYPFLEGGCVFFKNKKCIINKFKPFECLKTYGCKEYNPKIRAEALKTWCTKKIPKEIKEFIENAEEI
jgi:hypothetical protein